MANRKPAPPVPETPQTVAETAPHDTIATNRRLGVTPASSIPRAPAEFVLTPSEERNRRLTRPADALKAEVLAGLGVVIARKATYRSELGDLAPDVAQAETLLPRLNALQEALEVAEPLVAYLQELTAIAYSDASDYLKAVDEEVRHRARRNGALLTDYSRVLRLAEAHSQAITEGIARSRKDRKDQDGDSADDATGAPSS